MSTEAHLELRSDANAYHVVIEVVVSEDGADGIGHIERRFERTIPRRLQLTRPLRPSCGGECRRGIMRSVCWKREKLISREELDGLIVLLMRIDANVQHLARRLGEDDGEARE